MEREPARYLGHFALHLFAVLIIDIGDDPRDGGPHFLDGAHVSAMGGACGSPGGRRLSLALGGRTDKRVRRETFNRVENGSGEPGGPYPAGRGAQQRWQRLEAGLLGDGPLMELRHTDG